MMEWLTWTAVFFHGLGAIVFGGGLVWFALLFATTDPKRDERDAHFVDQSFVRIGMLMSVGLTLVIFSGITRYYIRAGGFSWLADTPADRFLTLKIAVFFLAWVFWGWFEVVIMHRFRQCVGTSPRPDDYPSARRRVAKALNIQLVFLMLILALGAAA